MFFTESMFDDEDLLIEASLGSYDDDSFIVNESYNILVASESAYGQIIEAQCEGEFELLKESDMIGYTRNTSNSFFDESYSDFDMFSVFNESDDTKDEKADKVEKKADKSFWQKVKHWLKVFWNNIKKYWNRAADFFVKQLSKVRDKFKNYDYDESYVLKKSGKDYNNLPDIVSKIRRMSRELVSKVRDGIEVSKDDIVELKEIADVIESKTVDKITYKIANPVYFINGKSSEVIKEALKAVEDTIKDADKCASAAEGDPAALKKILQLTQEALTSVAKSLSDAVKQAQEWATAAKKGESATSEGFDPMSVFDDDDSYSSSFMEGFDPMSVFDNDYSYSSSFSESFDPMSVFDNEDSDDWFRL